MKKSFILLTLVTSIAILSSCGDRTVEKKKTPIVKTDTVALYGNAQEASYPGRVKSSKEASLAFKVSGNISRLPAREGSFVRKGQLLAVMDPRDYQLQLDATTAEYEDIKSEVGRVVNLYQDSSATLNDYNKATYGLKQMEAKFRHHQDQLSDTRLFAPYDCYVQQRLYSEGETVGAGMPVITVLNAGAPEIEVNIPASVYARSRDFDSFYCTFGEYPGQRFPLHLIGISPSANLNQLYTARFALDRTASGKAPTAGVSAYVSIVYKNMQASQLRVPLSAILRKGEESFVYKYSASDSMLRAVPVQELRLLDDGGAVIDAESLKPGDVIASAGISFLADGEKVRILEK
jgi:RND family efflux transporter MFP subunit